MKAWRAAGRKRAACQRNEETLKLSLGCRINGSIIFLESNKQLKRNCEIQKLFLTYSICHPQATVIEIFVWLKWHLIIMKKYDNELFETWRATSGSILLEIRRGTEESTINYSDEEHISRLCSSISMISVCDVSDTIHLMTLPMMADRSLFSACSMLKWFSSEKPVADTEVLCIFHCL